MRWMICAALLFFPALAAHAQEPVSAEGATRTVAGRVVADETGEPLENVLVELVVQGLHALTDSRGRFRIEGAEPILDTLVASYFAVSEMRRALDLSRPGDQRVELRLAGTPPSSKEEEEAEEAEASITCSTWYVDARNRADRPVEIFPWLGNPDADIGSLSETERARGAGDLITVLGVGDRQGIRLRATWPILLLFGSRVSEAASGIQDRPFVGWITPEEQEIRRMQGLRFLISCEEPQK
jgi:hypothetical protein